MKEDIEFHAKIIPPKNENKKIKCKYCDIAYSGHEYNILFRAQKIVYFKFQYCTDKPVRICNECMLYFCSYMCYKYEMKEGVIGIEDESGKKTNFNFQPIRKDCLIKEILKKIKIR